MDWNTLGTWAAVVVALGISLRETFARRRQRTAIHLLTAARILPDAARLRDALVQTLEETDDLNPATSSCDALAEACDTFAARLRGMGLDHFKGQADQIDALPEPMVIPLVKALMLSDMLLETYVIHRSDGESISEADVREEFEIWRRQAKSIKDSLDWVVRGAETQLQSPRWRLPELH